MPHPYPCEIVLVATFTIIDLCKGKRKREFGRIFTFDAIASNGQPTREATSRPQLMLRPNGGIDLAEVKIPVSENKAKIVPAYSSHKDKSGESSTPQYFK